MLETPGGTFSRFCFCDWPPKACFYQSLGLEKIGLNCYQIEGEQIPLPRNNEGVHGSQGEMLSGGPLGRSRAEVSSRKRLVQMYKVKFAKRPASTIDCSDYSLLIVQTFHGSIHSRIFAIAASTGFYSVKHKRGILLHPSTIALTTSYLAQAPPSN